MQRLMSMFGNHESKEPTKIEANQPESFEQLHCVENEENNYRDNLQELNYHQGRSAQALSDMEKDLEGLEKCYSSNLPFAKQRCYPETKAFFDLQEEYKKLDSTQNEVHNALFQNHKTPTSAADEIRSLKHQKQQCVKEMVISERLGGIVKANKFFTPEKQQKFDNDLLKGWNVCKKLDEDVINKSSLLRR